MPTTSLATPGILRRLAGMGYELLLLSGVLTVTVLFPQAVLGATTHYVATATVLWTHIFLALLVYFFWFWLNGGQTLAMKTWRIRLVSGTGQPLRPAQALLRYLLCWPSILCFGIGIIWAFFDRDQQFLHDRLADTRLIKTA